MTYETGATVNLEMSADEAKLFNEMRPGVRKDLVAEYFRIRILWRKNPEKFASDWKNIQGLMLAHDGD